MRFYFDIIRVLALVATLMMILTPISFIAWVWTLETVALQLAFTFGTLGWSLALALSPYFTTKNNEEDYEE